jgi:hypothetical protein
MCDFCATYAIDTFLCQLHKWLQHLYVNYICDCNIYMSITYACFRTFTYFCVINANKYFDFVSHFMSTFLFSVVSEYSGATVSVVPLSKTFTVSSERPRSMFFVREWNATKHIFHYEWELKHGDIIVYEFPGFLGQGAPTAPPTYILL